MGGLSLTVRPCYSKREGCHWQPSRLLLHTLFRCFFGKFCRNEIFIGRPFFQFARAFQNILEQFKAGFFKNQICFPCILFIIPCHNSRDRFQIRLRELRLNTFCNLFRRMLLYIIHSFLKCVYKTLDGLRIFFDKALFCAESGVGNISAVFSERRYNIALSF